MPVIHSVCGNVTLRAASTKEGVLLLSTVRGSKQTEAAFFRPDELRKLVGG
jgi:hypothetical protein